MSRCYKLIVIAAFVYTRHILNDSSGVEFLSKYDCISNEFRSLSITENLSSGDFQDYRDQNKRNNRTIFRSLHMSKQ